MDGLCRLKEIVDGGERVGGAAEVLFDDAAWNVGENFLNLVHLFGI